MSAVIIDTHIILWDQLDPERVSSKAMKAIEHADQAYRMIMCEISMWEIAMLMKKKRLIVDITYLELMDQILLSRNYVLQGLTPEIAHLSTEITMDTKDPADRIIAATCMVLGLPLISADHHIMQSTTIKTIW